MFLCLFAILSFEGFQQQGMTGSGARQVNPAAGRPPRPAAVPQSDEGPQNKPQKSKIPVLEKHLINQLSSDEQNSINSKFQEATEADKKVPLLFYLFFCIIAIVTLTIGLKVMQSTLFTGSFSDFLYFSKLP